MLKKIVDIPNNMKLLILRGQTLFYIYNFWPGS